MKVIGIEHIGIAVEDLEKNASFWKNIIGLKHCGIEDVDGQGVFTDIYDTGSGKIELLVSKYPDSPISKFIKKNKITYQNVLDSAISESILIQFIWSGIPTTLVLDNNLNIISTISGEITANQIFELTK